MSRIYVNRFLGIAPKLEATLLATSQAQVAVNARLWSEGLRAFDGAERGETLEKSGTIQTIFRYNDDADWLHWTQDVDVVAGPIADDDLEKIYFTGTDVPRVTANDIFDDDSVGTNRPPDSYILGIPSPTSAPVASDSVATALAKCWVFTAVGPVWTDETTDINDVGASDVALSAAVGDIIYFGGAAQFNILSINVGTGGTGGAVVWEYYNGSAWAALTSIIDGTNAFINAGTNTVSFDVPANWVQVAVNGTTEYWVRARVTTALTGAPSLTQGFISAAGVLAVTATWVMTFVRKWSDDTIEESAPSPPSNTLVMNLRTPSVTLPDGTMATPGNYGITHKRLYRSEGGNYFFVSEETFATGSVSDDTLTQDLGDAIDTTLYLPPPDDMIGLIMLPNGVAAGFKGKTVYLSEPYRPHAYPLANQYAVNSDIVGLGNVGTTIIVLTKARPWVGRGVDPASYQFVPQPKALPCSSKRSIASSEYGVFWSSPEGIGIFDGAKVDVATREFITRREWQRDYFPTTIHGVVHDGHYFAWYETGTDAVGRKVGGGFVLDKTERAFLVSLGDYVDAATVSSSNTDLYIVRADENLNNWTYRFGVVAGDPLHYQWKSKEFITAAPENMAFAQIIADYGAGLTDAELEAVEAEADAAETYNITLTRLYGDINGHQINSCMLNGDPTSVIPPSADDYVSATISFKYWADGVLRLTRDVSSPDPFPLPSGFSAESHEFELSGFVGVTEVTIAGSEEELGSPSA